MEEYGGNLEAFIFDLYFGSDVEDAIEYLASLEESKMAVLSGMQEWWKAVLESDWEKERRFVLRMLKAEEGVVRRLVASQKEAWEINKNSLSVIWLIVLHTLCPLKETNPNLTNLLYYIISYSFDLQPQHYYILFSHHPLQPLQ